VTAEYPFAPNYLDLNGGRYHYIDEGEGKPVLMVHGNPTWSYYYRNVVLRLRDRYRCVVPDHIGCGRSDKPTEDRYTYTLSSRVADLTRLADELELDDITLVVHDWGGMIGMAWAVDHVDRIRKIVILNTGAFARPGGKTFPPSIALARVPMLGAGLVRGFSAFSRGANRFCVTRNPLPAHVKAAYLEPYDNWEHRIAVHRFVTDIPLKPSDPAWPVLQRTSDNLHKLAGLPIMVAWGMRDFVFDHHFLEEWERRFPDADVHRFEDAGHYILEDAKEEVLDLIDRFVDGPAAAESA